MELDGLILIDKPVGWTSHDVVAKIRSTLKKETGHKTKVGHTGTLDPLATGLMVVVVGSYCKRAGEFSKLDKTYEVTMKLGETSTTGDEEGIKTAVPSKKLSESEIRLALSQFQGEIMQTPPVYSAIKVRGKRAYKLAREGKELKMEPRKVTIYDIDLVQYQHPFLRFNTHVSSGTYIRSLVEDIGQKLGTGAYMCGLHRTKVGQFKIENSIEIAQTAIDNLTII